MNLGAGDRPPPRASLPFSRLSTAAARDRRTDRQTDALPRRSGPDLATHERRCRSAGRRLRGQLPGEPGAATAPCPPPPQGDAVPAAGAGTRRGWSSAACAPGLSGSWWLSIARAQGRQTHVPVFLPGRQQ
jgi:hypothetical protein